MLSSESRDTLCSSHPLALVMEYLREGYIKWDVRGWICVSICLLVDENGRVVSTLEFV